MRAKYKIINNSSGTRVPTRTIAGLKRLARSNKIKTGIYDCVDYDGVVTKINIKVSDFKHRGYGKKPNKSKSPRKGGSGKYNVALTKVA